MTSEKSAKRLGFRQQLTITFGIGILLTSLVSSIAISMLSSRAVYDRLVMEGYQSVETLASQSTLALLYHSEENGRDYAEALLTSPDVLGVAIFDLNHSPLLAIGDATQVLKEQDLIPAKTVLARETDSAWYFLSPVYTSPVSSQADESPFTVNPASPELLGYAQLVLGKNTLHTLAGGILKTNFLVSLALAVTLLIVLLFVTRRVTQPIKKLADSMYQATSGEKDVRATLEGPKDVVLMQDAFNKMMQVLEAREVELKSARDAALESARIKGEFAATVSHELRTPLNGVLGMLELLQGMGLNPKQADYVEVAKNSGDTLLTLINDILDFSRNDSGNLLFHKETFSLRKMLDEIIGLVGSQARRKGLDIGFSIQSELPANVSGDINRLQQVLINLIGNAIKFTETGEISVLVSHHERSASSGDRMLRFEVRDTGIGIPEEARKKIFEPFRQADASTTRKHGGTGLGLAICKQIIDLMGGQIGISDNPAGGSIFWFTVPVENLNEGAATVEDDSGLAGLRILIADDSEIVRQMVGQWCKTWKVECLFAETVQESINLVTSSHSHGKPLDFVLLDYGLHGIADASYSDLPAKFPVFMQSRLVLMMNSTASHPNLDDVSHSHYIDKPLRFDLLYKFLMSNLDLAPKSGIAQADNGLSVDGAKVLVVEDNRANQIVVAGMLERLNIKPTLVYGGMEAMQRLRNQSFDIILMDCNMPGMDGYETTTRVRAHESGKNRTPIIAMTANTLEGDIEKCLSAGMDDYVSKPLKLGVLKEMLAKWLKPGQQRDAATAPATRPRPSTAWEPKNLEESLDQEFFSELRETIGGAFINMINVFLEDMPIYMDELGSAINEGRTDQVGNIAHTVKGSSSNIGANKLADLCRRIEAANNTGDFNLVRELFASATAEAKALKALLKNELTGQPAGNSGKKLHNSFILVVDDDRSTRFAFRNILEEEGYNVIEAEDGAKAIELCKYRVPDLILMDAKMPVMDGFTACQHIRQIPESAHTPILIITGLDDEDSIERAFSVGATDYISKPVNFSVMRRRIAHLMHASRAERHMRHLAFSDTLTGLPNRARFTNHLNNLLEARRDNNTPLAIMFIDVDRFKLINDTLGHDAGDMLLKIVAERIHNCVRDDDLVARLGGDEFTVVLDNVGDRDVLETIARKICHSFSKPVAFLNQEIFVSVSIGISMFPGDATDIATLMKHADTAMFHAKRLRNDYKFFEPNMEAGASERLELEHGLRVALERNELVVHFQPQEDLKTGRIVGAEALVRWIHPERGLISPLEFIPLAEETGLINPIGELVLRESCRQLRSWIDRGYGPLRIAINISARQLEKNEIIDVIADILETTGIPPECLELEITESVIMNHAEEMMQIFRRLKEMNLLLAIDDFGTGYSSLAYLKRFPIDILKIDRSFVKDIPINAEDVAIVTGVIAMAKGLDLKVVAEGVENAEQKAFLQQQQCDYMQGYYLSKPLSADEFENKFLMPAYLDKIGNGENIAVLKPKKSP
ncbi:MAG: EAL domain-containing protein [Gammaproteobacteria bacterium]|nr:EAL domain-containing protein [Gammaproteobacteria bacterium]